MSSNKKTTQIERDRVRIVLFVGLAAGFLLGMFLAWLPLRVALSRFGFEDSFYYLRVARSIVQGKGAAFDGIHPTNGFHPLWMLVSILLVAPFRPGSGIPVHLLFSLCAVFHVLTAYLIYRTVILSCHRTAALIAAFLWLFNYNVAGIALCGLETSLFAFLTIATVFLYISWRRQLSVGQSAMIGLMVGVTALARFDGALLGFALAGDQLYIALRRRERIGRSLGRIVPMSLVGSVMMGPWMIWSLRVSGTILPNSQRALKLWIGSDALFAHGLLSGLFETFSTYAPEMGKIYGFVPMSSVSILLFAVFCIVLAWKHEKRAIGLPAIVFVAYPFAHALYYAVNFAPLNRYLYPAHLLIFTGVMTAIGCWLQGAYEKRFIRPLAIAAVVVVAANLLLSSARTWQEATAAVKTNSLHWAMYTEVVPWLRENVKPEERIGAFNCGIYGYFSGRTVVNLDGVINDSVIPALENRRLIPYLYEQRIEYVIDWKTSLDFAFSRYGGVSDYREKFEVVKSFEQPWGPYKGARLLVLRLVH